MPTRLEKPGRQLRRGRVRTRVRTTREFLQVIEPVLVRSMQPLVPDGTTDPVQRAELRERHQPLAGISDKLKSLVHRIHLPPRHRAPLPAECALVWRECKRCTWTISLAISPAVQRATDQGITATRMRPTAP